MPRPPGSHLNATPELAGRSRPAHRIHGAPFGSRASTRNRAPVGAATASGLPALVCLLCWPFAFRCLDWIGRSSGCCTVQRGYRSESSFFIREGRVRTDHTFVALPLYCHRYRLYQSTTLGCRTPVLAEAFLSSELGSALADRMWNCSLQYSQTEGEIRTVQSSEFRFSAHPVLW